uniref:Uncharacterized protein n=1 Tax=Podoviridae sp. ctnCN2 TaxID=2825274 RepID=A0A8S5PM41_9CAUD|nr:MAG TPA: hypothetical protein [Podoviridae sp. ctnCN2]
MNVTVGPVSAGASGASSRGGGGSRRASRTTIWRSVAKSLLVVSLSVRRASRRGVALSAIKRIFCTKAASDGLRELSAISSCLACSSFWKKGLACRRSSCSRLIS